MKIVTVLKFRSDLYFQDRIAFLDFDLHVNETTETIEDEEHSASGKTIAGARPRMKATITPTSVAAPLRISIREVMIMCATSYQKQ